jgi:nitronate monooxygenase
MNKLAPLTIKGKKIEIPIIQGGMGIGVSLSPLASAVAKEGGVGIISSAALDRLVSKRVGRKLDTYQAVYDEVSLAKSGGGIIGINIMVAIVRDYEDSVKAAIDADADVIISGGGNPLNLPEIINPKGTALIPIVSSLRALELLCKRWDRNKVRPYRPDAVVLEGPLAGGHLGFRFEELSLESNKLENLLGPIKDFAIKHGDFPVIVAGGIFSHTDIARFLQMGADGVQMGTRFMVTEESSASPEYKQAVIDARKDDIIIAERPGSPCGLPFRVLRTSPMFISALGRARTPKCTKGYVLHRDKNGNWCCDANKSNENSFCVCNGLLSSAGYNPKEEKPLYTIGFNAFRVGEILPVKKLMDELKGEN